MKNYGKKKISTLCLKKKCIIWSYENITFGYIFSNSAAAIKGKNTLSRETAVKIFIHSEVGSSLKGKNLLPLGANSFLLK